MSLSGARRFGIRDNRSLPDVLVAAELLEHEVRRVRSREKRAGDPVAQIADVHPTGVWTMVQERRTDDRPGAIRLADGLSGGDDVVIGRPQEELRDPDEEP